MFDIVGALIVAVAGGRLRLSGDVGLEIEARSILKWGGGALVRDC